MSIHVEGMRQRLARALEGELEVGDALGVGGFAAVFRAHDPFLDRDVAVKVLDPELTLTTDREAEFLNEARIVAGVEHPHIVPLYKAESRDGLLYLVMRLLPGKSLADRIAGEGRLPFADAARLAHETAQALAVAHARGVVHRDIKPDNILLDASGHAVVTDFGIARVTAHAGPDEAGTITGTPRYMAPEQLLGEAVDGKADVYALGVMLYEALTGRVPLEERSVQALIARHVRDAVPRVGDLRADTPRALAAAVERALSKDAAARPTAAELATMLAAARTPDALLTPKMARRKRNRRRLVILGVIVATASVVLYGVAQVVFASLKLMSGGDPPVLSALGTAVPDSLVEAARREGSLGATERVLYAFVPHSLSFGDAFLFTDSGFVRRSPDGFRRIPASGTTLLVERRGKTLSSGPRGFLIAKRKDAAPDTVYEGLSGAESYQLMTNLAAANSSQAQQKSAGPPPSPTRAGTRR